MHCSHTSCPRFVNPLNRNKQRQFIPEMLLLKMLQTGHSKCGCKQTRKCERRHCPHVFSVVLLSRFCNTDKLYSRTILFISSCMMKGYMIFFAVWMIISFVHFRLFWLALDKLAYVGKTCWVIWIFPSVIGHLSLNTYYTTNGALHHWDIFQHQINCRFAGW